MGPSIPFQRLGIMRSHFTEFFFGYEFSYILSLSLVNVDVINIICFLYCLLCNHCKTTFNVAKKRKLWCPRMALIMCVCVCMCRFWTSRDKRHRKPTWNRASLLFFPWNAEGCEWHGPLENAGLHNSTASFLKVKTWEERAFDPVSIRVLWFLLVSFKRGLNQKRM